MGHQPMVLRTDARLTSRPLPEEDRPPFHGSLEQWATDLERTSAHGVEHIVFSVAGSPAEWVEAMRAFCRFVR